MEAEMDDHLGYEKSKRSDSDDYRNGYKPKRVNSSYGAMEIEVPQDRKSTFEPKVVRKRQKDISDIDQKIISMYAKGMTTRQISETIEDIYGFETSEGFISDVTDKLLGNAVEIASLIPVRPSAQMIRISFTPRFFNSFNTESQYLALSLSPTLIESTSFLPSVLIPRITYAASFLITPFSRTE